MACAIVAVEMALICKSQTGVDCPAAAAETFTLTVSARALDSPVSLPAAWSTSVLVTHVSGQQAPSCCSAAVSLNHGQEPDLVWMSQILSQPFNTDLAARVLPGAVDGIQGLTSIAFTDSILSATGASSRCCSAHCSADLLAAACACLTQVDWYGLGRPWQPQSDSSMCRLAVQLCSCLQSEWCN